MVNGFGGFKLLTIVLFCSLAFQPIVLSKLLSLLLYYHGLYVGVCVWNSTDASNELSTTGQRAKRLFMKGHFVLFAPFFLPFLVIFAMSPVAFSFVYLPIAACISLFWLFASATLQLVNEGATRLQARHEVRARTSWLSTAIVLVTRSMVPGDAVYGEKRINVEEGEGDEKTKLEYRVWNPFRSKLAAAILGGVDSIHMGPGSKVLYLGAASGTSVSHVSDLVGETGCVYAVEFSHRPGRDLINVAKKRTNIIPIIEDARHPNKYRMLIGMVDCVFADVAQPDQARIVALNSHLFLKNEGHVVISVKANCIDSTAPAEHVFAQEVNKLKNEQFKPLEQLTLEPYERDHAVVIARYRDAEEQSKKKQKTS